MKKTRFDYFQAFVEFTEKAMTAADMLNSFLCYYRPEDIWEQMNNIHVIEHEADIIRHTVIEHLSREFVAPIEREDIVSLVREFDNVVDGIDEVMRKISMYQVPKLREDVIPFTELLVTACKKLNTIVVEFSTFRKSKEIKERIIEINTLESEADTLHFHAISTLFGNEKDAVQLLAWQNIYDAMEDCFDNCEHAAEIIEGVILKNS